MTPVWTTSRASGLAALMTASLAISCGLLMALRVPALRRRAPELRAAHQALANATFALIGVHALSLPGDRAAVRAATVDAALATVVGVVRENAPGPASGTG